jgi:hypothetical protein
MIFIVKSDPNNLSVAGEITVPSFTFSPAANGMPTFPGPTSQAPSLQAKVDVSIVGGAVAAAAGAATPSPAASSAPVIMRILNCRRMPTSLACRPSLAWCSGLDGDRVPLGGLLAVIAAEPHGDDVGAGHYPPRQL